jgi:hypothetical protein
VSSPQTIPRAAAWLAAAESRISRRAYDGRPIDDATTAALAAQTESFRPNPDARVELIIAPDMDVFTGIIGSYGKVRGAPAVLVFIGDHEAPNNDEHIGYTGEGIVLEAAALGLQTCWVGGFFDRRLAAQLVRVRRGELIQGVSPVGYAVDTSSASVRVMESLARSRTRLSLETIAPGVAGWPAWARAAAAAARLAPSAINRQPWRFRLDGSAVVISLDSRVGVPPVPKRLDCGIAMLHFELGALAEGVGGTWTPLEGRDVARFAPDGDSAEDADEPRD